MKINLGGLLRRYFFSKVLISLALLFSFSFSMVHEYAFAFYDTDHCNVSEYVEELSTPSEHGDICDIHFEYHHTFILTPYISLQDRNLIRLKQISMNESYSFKTSLKFTKPPIS